MVLAEITIKSNVRAFGQPITALIGRHHVIPRSCQRQHHLAPGIGQFRETVQQQHTFAAGLLKAGLQNVHIQAIAVIQHPRTDARR